MDTQRRASRVEAIQLLRAIAASVVAIVHFAFAFADHIGPGLGFDPAWGIPRAAGHASQASVALFFVVSGYIMVVSSRRLFGQPGATRIFWTRRCVRILPPYWLASLLLAGVLLWVGMEVDLRELLLSMALIPTGEGAVRGRPVFFLWPGWTLFYEMAFYLLFGLGLTRGRRGAIVLAGTGIALLVAMGAAIDIGAAWAFSLTRPVLLIFLGGMLIALLREKGLVLAGWARWLCGCLALVAWILVPEPAQNAALGFDYVLWAGLPALLVAIAMLAGPLQLPGFWAIGRLGDLSYALYLLHLPFAHLWLAVFPLSLGAWPFLLSLIAATFAASLAAFMFVERPMTQWLNRRLSGRREGDALLQQSGV